MMGIKPHDSEYPEFVEVDPTGRYGRYNEILGKGASKTVYRAFDEYEGIEVAWNQVKLYDFLQSPEDLERLYCEIHLLKTLKHKNIMKFYTSWVDISNRNINFVTEMFTSGTLRQYRQKHRRVNIRAVKHWCNQILMGLLYLHSHDPPVIHRDLKCDNIFINGNQGEVKIGDLGLAAILRKSHAVHCVGTPEFMAPEVYEEEYNELVDIYSFGMCILEMVTFEYPYSECTHPAQIYKKVISGTKPEALYRVKDPEVRQFVEKCLATASRRPSARELLKDPFLQFDDLGSGFWEGDIIEMGLALSQPSYNPLYCDVPLITNGFSDDLPHETEMDKGWDCNSAEFGIHGIDLFNSHEDEPFANVDITIKGRKREDGSIFLRLRIGDKEGRVRNIYFPFDIKADTALGVATEMVAELDITDYEVTRIAEMIDGEVSALIPEWKPGPHIEESLGSPTRAFYHNCASNGELLDYLSTSNSCCTNLQSTHCSHLECGAMHSRFEEIMYQVEGSEQCVAEGPPVLSSSQSDGLDLISQASRESNPDEEEVQSDHLANNEKIIIHMDNDLQTRMRKSLGREKFLEMSSDDHENEIRQELRWLKEKHEMERRDYSNQQLGGRRAPNPSPDFDKGDFGVEVIGASVPKQMKSFHLGTHFSFRLPNSDTEHCWNTHPDSEAQRARDREANSDSSREKIFTAESFYAGVTLPNSLLRAKSLPVDAVDV